MKIKLSNNIFFFIEVMIYVLGIYVCCIHSSIAGAQDHRFTIVNESEKGIKIKYTLDNPDELFVNKAEECIHEHNPPETVHRTLVAVPENAVSSIEVLSVEYQNIQTGMKCYDMACCSDTGIVVSEKNLIGLKAGIFRGRHIAIIEVMPLQCCQTEEQCHFAANIVFKIKISRVTETNYPSGVITDNLPNILPPSKGDLFFERILQHTVLNYSEEMNQAINGSNKPYPKHIVQKQTSFPFVKMTVKKPGMYKVTHDSLLNAEVDVNGIDPRKIMVTCRGETVPVFFMGEDDGIFDQGDYFVFYGEPVKSDMLHSNAQNKFTLSNVYWIESGIDNASRMNAHRNIQGANPKTNDFSETVRVEQDKIMIREHIDYFFWENFPDHEDTKRDDPASKEFGFDLRGINTRKKAGVRVRLFGYSYNDGLDPDHHFRFTINGVWSEDYYFDGWGESVFESEIPASILTEGANTFTIANMMGYNGEEDLVRLDWIEIDYRKLFIADENTLQCRIDNETAVTVTAQGFSERRLQVYDITDTDNTSRIEGTDITGASPSYDVSFTHTPGQGRVYCIVAEDHYSTPALIEPYTKSGIKNSGNRADYIMITHPDFLQETDGLASYRERQGYDVTVVDVQDIYNEFNYGIAHQQAIKDFLKYAYTYWTPPAPAFALLVGDGCSDATDRLNLGNKNFIPVINSSLSSIGTGANDTWYAQINGDDVLPDIILGRLPVKNATEMAYIVERIVAYEQSEKHPWMRNVLLVADNDPYFVSMNEQLSNHLPFNYASYAYNAEEENDPSKILYRVNEGQALTVYSGHGNIESWKGLLYTSDLDASLGANGKPTFLITLTCFNGHFSNPIAEGFGEKFIRNKGGALAVFAPTSGGYTFEHHLIAERIFDILFLDNDTCLGTASMQGKIEAYLTGAVSDGTFEQYLYFGDPAAVFKVCKFYVNSPSDNETVFGDTPFSWTADGYDRFVLQFSSSPDFKSFNTIPVFTTNNEYTPGPVLWNVLKNLHALHGNVLWRVGGMVNKITIGDFLGSMGDEFVFTEPLSFEME